DLVSPFDLEQLDQVIRRLNPKAKILRTRESRVPLEEVMGTGLYQLSDAEASPGWLAVPRGQEHSETDEYGISHFVYQRRRPFHAARLSDAMNGGFGEGRPMDGVLRSKGLIWLASRHNLAYDWSQAGCSIRMTPGGLWWAAAPSDEWPDDEEAVASISAKLVGPYGDRHQELVFIGHDMDQAKITETLDQCLLSDAEFSHGPDVWSGFADPFPSVELQFEDDDSMEIWQ
ncbi:MAG: GTP-binding protein, partial [Planctomycetota bacterium]